MKDFVLADKVEALFGNFPPALSIAFATTKNHEKSERTAMTREKHCSEIEAVYEVVRRVEQFRVHQPVGGSAYLYHATADRKGCTSPKLVTDVFSIFSSSKYHLATALRARWCRW